MSRNLPGFIPKGPPEDPDRPLRNLADRMVEPHTVAVGDGRLHGESRQGHSGRSYAQFIDHDITFDPASSLQRQNDPDALHNFRTPRFHLDSVYGAGPIDDPFMYDPSVDGGGSALDREEPGQRG